MKEITILLLVAMVNNVTAQNIDYKNIIKELIKEENKEGSKIWKEFVSEDFKHTFNIDTIKNNLEGLLSIKNQILEAIPNTKKENILLIQEGKYLVEYSAVNGKHTGTYNGIPPSDEEFTWVESNVYEFEGTKIKKFHPNIRLEKFLDSLSEPKKKYYEPKPTLMNRVIGGGIKFMSWFARKPKPKGFTGIEYNREIVRKYAIEFKNQQKFLVFPKLYRPYKFRHHFNFPSHKDKLFSFVSVGREFLSGFPDVQVELKALIAEGDYVVEFNDVIGTHKGNYAGIEATNRIVKWTETHIYRLENGKIVENIPAVNFERIIQQIQ